MKRRRIFVILKVVALALIPGLICIPVFLQSRPAKLGAARHERPAAHVYLPLVSRPFQAACPEAAGVPDAVPSWGTPVALTAAGTAVWVANPDAASVTLVDPQLLEKVAEIPLGGEPWSLAVSPDSRRLYVIDRADGALLVVDTATRALCARIEIGPEPGQLALSPDGREVYVTVTFAGEVVVVNAVTLAVTGRISVPPLPFALAVTDNGDAWSGDEEILVTHLLALPEAEGPGPAAGESRAGVVTVIDAGTKTVSRSIRLAPDEHGFPNLLVGISLNGERAWLPHVRAAPRLPNGLTTTVFAGVAVLNLSGGGEDFAARLLLNDLELFGSPVNNPVAAVPAPDGRTLYIVLAGSDLVEVVDISEPLQPRLLKFLPAGRNPRGLALSPDGRRAYVMSYLSRALTVLDLEALQVVAEIPVTAETLAADVLAGKLLFHNASDPRLSQGSWISCASCHPDGGSDGVTWMFPDGPRQSPPLWNASRTLPWHWSAALDEGQDVEETIQIIQHGLGLAPGSDPPLLGVPNADRSAALDALAAFLERGIRIPQVAPAGDSAQGRAIFETSGCADCHGGPHWTISALPGAAGTLDPDGNGMVDGVLRQVGTLNALDVRGETGFDPPSLLGVGLTAPYFHDGSMPDLGALLRSGHPAPPAGGDGLSEAEMAALIRFLKAIGPDTAPVEAPGGGR